MTTPNSTIGAVVIGADFQSLGVVRSLVSEGIPVFLVEHERGIARRSRHVQRRASRFEFLKDDAKTVEWLLELARKEGLEGWTLFPNDDEIVKFLAEHREPLSTVFRCPLPAWEITKNIYYKQHTYQKARKIGLSMPGFYEGGSADEILAQSPLFPLVLKPTCKKDYYPATHKKAIRVNDEAEFRSEFATMASIIPPGMIVVQELIPGGTDVLFSVATVFDGEDHLVAMCANRLRQHPMDFGHATTYAVSVDRPEMLQLAKQLLKAIGYSGIAEVEFMYDTRDEKYKLIEINARPWGWNTLAKAAGVNTPATLHRFLCGLPVEKQNPKIGVKWIRLLTDCPTVLTEVLKGRMSPISYLKTLTGQKEFAVFSFRDPLPFIYEALMAPYLWWKKGF